MIYDENEEDYDSEGCEEEIDGKPRRHRSFKKQGNRDNNSKASSMMLKQANLALSPAKPHKLADLAKKVPS